MTRECGPGGGEGGVSRKEGEGLGCLGLGVGLPQGEGSVWGMRSEATVAHSRDIWGLLWWWAGGLNSVLPRKTCPVLSPRVLKCALVWAKGLRCHEVKGLEMRPSCI